MATEHMPQRAEEARDLVDALFAVGLAKSSPSADLNLITMVETGKVRFQLNYPNDQAAPERVAGEAYQKVSALADSSGEGRTQRGRMVYAELWGFDR